MCGIVGLFSFKPIKDKEEVIKGLSESLIRAKERGDDATGIALINTETGKYEVFKKDVAAEDFVKDKDFKKTVKNFGDFNIILGHTRAETQGTKAFNKNNHPFFHRDTGSILIHNGTLRDYEATKKQYGLEPDGDCDSEIILSMYDKFKDFKKAIKRIRGNFAVALYHNKKLYIYKDSNPVVLMTDKKVSEDKIFYFATKEEYIENFFHKEEAFYDIFELKTKDEDYVMKELSREDLVEIDFNNNKVKLTPDIESGVIEIKDRFKKEPVKTITDFRKEYAGSYKGSYVDNYSCRKLDDRIFDSFLTQVKSTSKRMNDEQKSKLMGFVESIIVGDINGTQFQEKVDGIVREKDKDLTDLNKFNRGYYDF